MKLNLHKKKLVLFILIGETDGFRKISLFEDYDETFLNHNFKNISKAIEYTCEDNLEKMYSILKNNRKKKNFIDNFLKKN